MGVDVVVAQDWWTAGWQDLVPEQGLFLHMVVATATARTVDGDLAGLLVTVAPDERGRARVALSDPLLWVYPAVDGHVDEHDRAAAERRRETWQEALAAAGIPVPTTIAELADVLVALGVFRRGPAGGSGAGTAGVVRVERWRSPEGLPLASDVLALPAQWVAAHEEAGRVVQADRSAQRLIRYLREDCDRPRLVVSTVAKLALATDLPAVAVRRGLAALCADGDFRVLPAGGDARTSTAASPSDMGGHTEFALAIDWRLFDVIRDRVDPTGRRSAGQQ